MKINGIPMCSLQVFADGGAASPAGTGGDGTAQGQGVTAAAAVPQTKGAKSNPLSGVKYGIQEEAAPDAGVRETDAPPLDPEAEFEKLIKGQYKQQYDARVQETIRKRLKGSKETVEKLQSLQPMLEMLAKKYGVDAADVAALTKAVEDDDAYYREEAEKRSIPVAQLKEIRKVERENESLRRQVEAQQRQRGAEALYAAWMRQAE